MLRMGKLTDYATVVLASLAQDPTRHRAAAELAERTRLSRPTVSKVLKGLQRAGMVISSRGSQGGYRLARDPEHITAAQILDVFEGPIAITECSGASSQCGIERLCRVGGAWQRINCRHSARTGRRDAAAACRTRFAGSCAYRSWRWTFAAPRLERRREEPSIRGVTQRIFKSCQANHKTSKHSSARNTATASSRTSNRTACRPGSTRAWCARFR